MSPEELIARRTGRRCLPLPSNRLGLYLALRHWTSPGQRLLMSPISADEILFLVLAAGLLPVIAPLSRRDGNLDLSRTDLSSVDAVLTTNLYGLPDPVAGLAGKVVIEDVAHALETTVGGRPLGTFGQAGVFSLSKHAGAGSGGVLAVESGADLKALERARDRLLLPGAFAADLAAVGASIARHAVTTLELVRPALRLVRALGLVEPRQGYRIPLRERELKSALAAGSALRGRASQGSSLTDPPDDRLADPLAALDSWIRADLHHYRSRYGRLSRRYQAHRLGRVPRDRAARLAGIAMLAELPSVAPAVLDNLDQPLFRVPLLVSERDPAIAELERHGVATGYLYDPPFDDYAAAFTEASPYPGDARWWARHVLPVNPLRAHRAWEVLKGLSPAPSPAR
ncbi:DegT/DnrJ/EryC1/StrS family aminotransferase [Nonomuraea soli]|uniref:DegT/DnrJ/EryC1/StrS aminotransferase family protein n=1 Tax=Nonomuraea soli TaxID=1032476 RepID=A0A7W0HSG9_9ACTN|nr:DegT/DnrJ/EryC1/StrS family aminotransferase [Nonomuraea soli]MBA2893636.1 hypothetical protein [Nonomuraea soli]